MNYKYNDKAFVVDDMYGKYLCNPLSRSAIEYIESIGGIVTSKHRYDDYEIFRYRVSFPDNKYSASIIKGYGTYGHANDQWEVGILYDGNLTYDTDITADSHDVIGCLEEKDVLAIIRLLKRLDENGRIKPLSFFFKPLETSQNEQDIRVKREFERLKEDF